MVWPVIGAVLVLAVTTFADAQPRVGAQAPAITGRTWLNSPALTLDTLKGRVVLVEFWTHG